MLNGEYKGKWIVHPHSFRKKGSRAVSIIREDYHHGIDSYGWYNDSKILFCADTMYGLIDDELVEAAIGLAIKRCEKLNLEESVEGKEL